MFKNIYFKSIIWSFYTLGDLLSHLDYNWSYRLYQKCMQISCTHDEKINFWFWKQPHTDNENI
jgi:hypothetical protein